VGGVFVELPDTTPVMVLRESEGDRRELHIPIGYPEATWIAYALRDIPIGRPITQQLLADVMVEYGLQLEQAVVSSFRNGNFYAHLDLIGPGERRVVSCRPSDAAGLVLRLPGAGPLLVVDDVMDRYGRPSGNDGSGLIRDADDQRDEDVVGHQGGPPVGDEGEGHTGDGEEPQNSGHDEKGLEAKDGGEAGGEELGKVGPGSYGGAQP